MVKNEDIKFILDRLEENYPDAECARNYEK